MLNNSSAPHLQPFLEGYQHHLSHVAGLTPGTCAARLRQAQKFLTVLYPSTPLDWSELSAPKVLDYVLRSQAESEGANLPALTSCLRCLLRFVRLRGYTALALERAVPPVAHVPSADPPQYLSEVQLQAVLATPNRRTFVGRRDYAILLCLARLGLRPGEVARLHLADFIWRESTVRLIQTKGRRASLLPLSQAVGDAVVAYLRGGRPQTKLDWVFLSVAPQVPALTAIAISQIARQAILQAVPTCPAKGAGLLRHTFATHLVQNGASLKAVADLLRHRQLNTTLTYAKVNLPMLAELALPWPEVTR
jgi:site-specific recombinase XerD